jgi:hypothetical protein
VGLHEDLRTVSELQGKVPIDGTKIAGFGGPNDPPAPRDVPTAREMYGALIEYPPQTGEPEAFDDPDDVRDDPPSPLIPPVDRMPIRRPAKVSLEEPDLTVLGDHARFQEHDVRLLASEVGQIKVVVLRAIQRVMRARLVEVEKVLPKRKRRSKAGTNATGPILPTTATGVNAPKKRGRPRKQA